MDLPYISKEPGVGGKIREKPEYFQVEEVPVYSPSGEGEHLYVNITKKGISTPELIERIKALGFYDEEVGFAGLKDKHAVTSQTISIQSKEDSEKIKEKIQSLGVKVNWTNRHSNKLKPGHLKGNKFQIILTGVQDRDFEKAKKIAESLKKTGVPNYYGEQRFGVDGENKKRAEEYLLGKIKIRDRWLRRFLLSSYASYLFNKYLSKRVESGFELMKGDIAKKHDTGGLFIVEDLNKEKERYSLGEISFTGPMFGKKLWFAEDLPGKLEKEVLTESGLDEEQVKKLGDGLRRVGRILLNDLEVEKVEEGIKLSFSLPKGSFATVVLREFMKSEKV